MAYTATVFLLRENGAEKTELEHLHLINLSVVRALVVHEKDTSQLIHVHAAFDRKSEIVTVRLSSKASGMAEEHGSCEVLTSDPAASPETEWKRMQRLVRGRVESLSASPKSHRMARSLLYELFASVVDYQQSY